jgi:hypothetical protein
LRAVGRFAHQVELVFQVLLEFRYHFARAQPLAVGEEFFDHAGGGVQQRDVVCDHRGDAGSQHLHCDRGAVVQAGEMHLRHRGRSHRVGIEFGEHLRQRPAVGGLQRGGGLDRGEGRHAVLQLRQFVGDVERHQVAAGRQHLPELDEDRPQRFECQPQPHRARLFQWPPD